MGKGGKKRKAKTAPGGKGGGRDGVGVLEQLEEEMGRKRDQGTGFELRYSLLLPLFFLFRMKTPYSYDSYRTLFHYLNRFFSLFCKTTQLGERVSVWF